MMISKYKLTYLRHVMQAVDGTGKNIMLGKVEDKEEDKK